jgi:predicted HicB family RNase H-like nuclease
MIALAAAGEGKSINAWVDETLAEAAARELAESDARAS